MNTRKTKKVIQSDYEDLYTGPFFILQIRYAQLLAVIFVSLTFSAGMPLLYLIVVINFVMTYWFDKILLLRYFRLTSGYNRNLSEHVVSVMPYAAIIHVMFGLMIFSYPYILHSDATWSLGNNSQYFNKHRLG